MTYQPFDDDIPEQVDPPEIPDGSRMEFLGTGEEMATAVGNALISGLVMLGCTCKPFATTGLDTSRSHVTVKRDDPATVELVLTFAVDHQPDCHSLYIKGASAN